MNCDGLSQTMLRPTSRQHRERLFEWKRVIGPSSENDAIFALERPNPEIFKNVMDKHKDELYAETVTAMNAIKIKMENNAWNKRILIRQVGIPDFPEDYEGCRNVGRSYGATFTNIYHKIVNTLYMDTHRYIDAINCFPTILFHAGSHLDVEALEAYVADRSKIFDLFYEAHGISKGHVKTAINAMIGSSPRLPADFGLGGGMEDVIRTLSEHPYILKLQSELVSIANDIALHYPKFNAGMEAYARRTGKGHHIKGVVLSYFCQDVEDSIMRVVLGAVQQGKEDECGDWIHQFVWKYDGILFPKTTVVHADETIQMVEASVFEKYGIRMRFAFKDITNEAVAYQDCAAPPVVDQYLNWKKGIDLRFVKFLDPPRYGMLKEDGTYKLLSYGQSGIGGDFGFILKEEPREWLERWGNDKDKVIYKGMDFAPPPLECRHGYLNTFRGFKVNSLVDETCMTTEDVEIKSQLMRTHMKNLCNGDDQSFTYLLKHMAWIVQKPGIKTQKVVFIRSVQGTGKDQFFNGFAHILGFNLVHKVTNMSMIKGTQSSNLENKIMLCLSECAYKDFENGEDLKDMATRPNFTVQQKYVPEYQARCMINIFMFSNKFGSMNLDMDDRRMLVLEANPRMKDDREYHEAFAAYILDQTNQIAVYRYFSEMDISDFNPMNSDTKTRIHRIMATQTSNYAAWFLNENFHNWVLYSTPDGNDYRRVSDVVLKVSNTVFNDALKGFCQKMKIADKESTQKLTSWALTIFTEASNKMARFAPEGITPISQGTSSDSMRIYGKKGRVKTFYIPAVQQWLQEVCVIEDMNDEEGGDDGGHYETHHIGQGVFEGAYVGGHSERK